MFVGIALNVGAPFGSAIFTGEVSKESLVLAIGGWSYVDITLKNYQVLF